MDKFEKIAASLIEDINNRKFVRKLPSEREFARIYNTTPMTVAKALNLLQKKNLVIRKRGNGTFVNEGKNEKTRIRFSIHNELIDKKIKELLSRRFPEYYFIYPADDETPDCFTRNDIVWHRSSIMPASFDKLCRPLPLSYVTNKIKDGNINGEAFNMNRNSMHYYGVPVLYSPVLVVYNKSLFRKLELPLPEKPLQLKDVYRIKNHLKAFPGIYPFAVSASSFSPAMNCIFAAMGKGRTLGKITLDELKKGLGICEDLYRGGIDNHADFMNGNVLFTYMCRHPMEQYFGKRKVSFEWDMLPVFYNNNRVCTVGAESCFISASSLQEDGILLPIMDYLISPEIQNHIASKRFCIPVLKSSAIDSISECTYRDDYFFSECRNIVYENNLFEKDSLWIFFSFINDYFAGRRSFQQFATDSESLFKSDRLRKNTLKSINFKMEF